MSWAGVVAICLAIGGVGAAADQFLKSKLKRYVYDQLLTLWIRLEDARVADLPASVAAFALSRLKLGRDEKSRTAAGVKILLISFAVTAVSAISGRLVRRYTFPSYEARALSPSLGLVDATAVHTQWLFDRIWDYFPTLIVNLVFDAATVLVTIGALREICRRGSAVVRYAIVSANFGVALVLAVCSLGVARWAVGPGLSFWRELDWSAECIFAVLAWNTHETFAPGFDDAFVGLSTLIPISAYLVILAVAIQARVLLVAMRRVSLYWLELATEPLPREVDARFKPFTLLGLVFGTFGIVVKVLLELSKQ